MDFEGKTIIVTGASSGIGAATARRLGELGANVVLAARRAERLDEVAADMPADRTLAHPADISDPAACEALVAATLDRFGALDGLFANAGIAEMGRLEDVDQEAFRRVIDINVTGTQNTIRAAWEALKASRGAIVVTSSVSGMRGDFGGWAYNASKGALTLMVQGLALDAGSSGVRVNAVAPSFTRTEMAKGLEDNADAYAAMTARIPMGRPGEPEEVADAVAFLFSPYSRFVNGVVLPVDGGLSASNGQAPVA